MISDEGLGRLAVEAGALTGEQLTARLAEVRRVRELGLDVGLRDLLVRKGDLTAQQIEELLLPPADASPAPGCSPDDSTSFGLSPSPDGEMSSDRPPRRLRGYRLEEEIGRGAMGVVFRAVQEDLGRTVALKVLPESLGMDSVVRGRFIEEARSAASLRHPGIVPVIEAGEEDGVHFFAMELVDGSTLHSLVAEQPSGLDPVRAAGLAGQCARALDYAHAQGLIHRDVKPHNIIITEGDRAVLTDFGLAKRLFGGPAQSFTRPGTVVGTPIYMSPEQASSGDTPLDARTDVYSLGATLYEAVVGRPPFDPEGDVTSVLESVAYVDPPPPRLLRPDLPRDLDTVITRAMAKEPGRRYRSALEMAEDLDRFIRGDPVVARPVGFLERGVRRLRRHPWRVAAVVLTLLALPLGIWSAREVSRSVRAREALLEAALLFAQNDFEASEEPLQRAQRERPEWPQVWIRWALLRREQGDLQGAKAFLDRALALSPSFLEALIERGSLGVALDELDQAGADLALARTLGPSLPRPILFEGQLMLRRGEAAGAAALAELALARAVEQAVRERRPRPDAKLEASIHLLRGRAELALGHPEQALEFMQRGADAWSSAKIIMELAQTHLALDRAWAAKQSMDTLLARDPDDARAYELRAKANAESGDVKASLADIQHAISRGLKRAHLQRAELRFRSQDASESSVDYDLDGVVADANLALEADEEAGVLSATERVHAKLLIARASEILLRIQFGLNSKSGQRERLDGLYSAVLEAVEAARRTGDHGAKVAKFVLVGSPRGLLAALHLRALLARGRMRYLEGDFSGAREDHALVVDLALSGELSASRYAAKVELGRVALRLGQSDLAEEYLEAALALDPDRPDAWRLRGMMKRKREPEAAMVDFRRALDLSLSAEDRAGAFYAEAIESLSALGGSYGTNRDTMNFRLLRANSALFRASEVRRGFSMASALRARCLHLGGLHEDAVRLARQATRENPSCVLAALERVLIMRDFLVADADAVLRALQLAEQAAQGTGLKARVCGIRAQTLRILSEDWQGALAEAERGLKEPPQDEIQDRDRYLLEEERARALAQIGRIEEAKQVSKQTMALRRRLTGDRSWSLMLTTAGRAAESQRDFQASIRFLDRAVMADPGLAIAYRRRGAVRWRLSRWEFHTSFIDLVMAVELEPSLAAPFYEVEGRLSDFLNLMPEHMRNVDEFVSGRPEIYTSYFVRGYLLYKQGQFDLSREDFLETERLNGGHYLTDVYLAAIAIKQGELDEARKLLLQAEKHSPTADNGMVSYWFARLEVSHGRLDSAKTWLLRAWDGGFKFPDRIRQTPGFEPLLADPQLRHLIGGG